MRHLLFSLCLLISTLLTVAGEIRGTDSINAPHEFDLSRLKEANKVVGMLVIGAGPAGLTAGMNGGNLGINTVVLTGYDLGGQISQTSTIENMPGFRKGAATELVNTLHDQAQDFGAIVFESAAMDIDVTNWPYKVTLDTGEIINALSVIIATGSEVKKCGVEGEARYFGKGVSPCAKCDGHFYKNKKVIVIGGGDTAIEEAMQLSPYANEITILVRGPQMKAAHRMQDKIKGFDKVKVQYNKTIVEILGNETQVTGVKVQDTQTKIITTMDVDGVFLAIGRLPRNELVVGKLKLDRFGYIHTDESCQSVSHLGIFAAGEVGNPNCAQAVEAASLGSIAANSAGQFLRKIGITDSTFKELQDKLFVS